MEAQSTSRAAIHRHVHRPLPTMAPITAHPPTARALMAAVRMATHVNRPQYIHPVATAAVSSTHTPPLCHIEGIREYFVLSTFISQLCDSIENPVIHWIQESILLD